MHSSFKAMITTVSAAIVLSGCASFGPKLDASRAKSVKTVAIIGFEVQQQQPTDNFGINKFKNAVDNGGIQNSPQYQGMAKNIYETLANNIQQKTKWNVVSYQKLTANKAYSAFVKEKMEGMRSTSMMGQGAELIPLNGVLDVMAFRKMSMEQKAAFAKDLGVDAIAEYTVIQSIDQPWMSVGHAVGMASFEYKSRSNLIVYSPNNEEPLWQIQNVDGQPVSSKGTAEGLSQMERVAKVGSDSAQSSITKMVENYNVQ
ncbi:MAG: hypothetical protein V4692_06740 [Bdellovibrionota bacterium]